jgi:two-component system cell cycle response regulator
MSPGDGPEDITNATPPGRGPIAVPKGPSPYLMVISGPSFGEMYRIRADRTVLGRGEKADVRVLDDGISRAHTAVEREGGRLVLVDLGSTNGTYCNGTRVGRQELVDGDKISIGTSTILKFTYQDPVDERYQKQLFESALRDGLTATFNRRYFVDRLHTEMRFAVRHSKALGLLFVDIDHFKKINDNHGHQAGDLVLGGLARELLTTIRTEDVLARYGGEEFAIICREIELPGVQVLAERLRAAIERKRFEHNGAAIPVTVSIGAAGDRRLTDPQALIAAADAAMYEAKRTGRNRVAFHPAVAAPRAAR